MESCIVIKVKYGETLRRFIAHINEDELELDMEALRAKIRSLFNLAPNADLTLTYIDVDGDVVTLVDEDDLRDVISQCLNPFRINVLVSNDKGGSGSYARSSENSTPMKSPRVQPSLPNISSGVSEVLNSIPEPFRQAISKLSLDVASKAASSAPLLTDLIDCFSKMHESHMLTGSQSQVGAEPSTQSGISQSNMNPLLTKGGNSSKDGGKQEVVPNATFAGLSSKNSQNVDLENATRGVGAPVTTVPASVDLNLDFPGAFILPGTTTLNGEPVASVDNRKEKAEGSKGHSSDMSGGNGGTMGSADPIRPEDPYFFEVDKHMRRYTKHLSSDFKQKYKLSSDGSNYFNKCPFSGMPLTDESAVPPVACHRTNHTFRRGYSHTDGMGVVFHRGVRCDGCGVHPITGPRFKSKVKEDYDLCSICIATVGNENDYIRIDHPLSHRQHDPVQRPQFPQLATPRFPLSPYINPNIFKGGLKAGRPKLDSRFISDVNVMDGTPLAPSSPFTKIWRMRNNGTLLWPRGTNLVWIGGDRFSDAISVEIEMPADGVLIGCELNIAVDFKAPEQPGRYISYWRMASPSGQKFGQRVWVLIQVDASLKQSFCDGFQGLNLNLPPVNIGYTGIVDVNVEPMVDYTYPDPPNPDTITEPVEPIIAGEQPNKDQERNFPINDTLLVGGVSEPVPQVVSSSVSYPIIDLSDTVPPVPSHEPSPPVDVAASYEQVVSANNVEQTLLKELEEMGFKEVDLNKEVLRMNEYNLEQSLDALCGVAEWDPILEELDEMGFYDREKNKKLLKKNNGSIKRVVMNLIAGEQA